MTFEAATRPPITRTCCPSRTAASITTPSCSPIPRAPRSRCAVASRVTASRSTLRALSTSACGLPPTTPRLWRSSWTGHTTMDTEDDVFEHKVNTIVVAPGATTSAPLALPCSRGSAVLANGGPVDAARHPERQSVTQKARHDQKVYALPFLCQAVHGGQATLRQLSSRVY